MDVDEGTSNQKEAQQEQQQEEESKGNHPEEHKSERDVHKSERDVDMHQEVPHSEQSQANQNAGDQQQELEEWWKKLNDDVTQL